VDWAAVGREMEWVRSAGMWPSVLVRVVRARPWVGGSRREIKRW